MDFAELVVYRSDKKERLGGKNYGGYVVAILNNYDCYLSAGIGEDASLYVTLINIKIYLSKWILKEINFHS